MWQLGGMILLALSAWGYIALHDKKQQEIGAAEVRAQLEKERADVEADIARANQEGKLKFAALYEAAVRRNRQAEQQAATDALTREAANELRARTDPEYEDWRKRVVPAYPANRLRDATLLAAHESGRGGLPGGIAVPAAAVVSSSAVPIDQRWFSRIRSFLGGATAPGMGSGGPGGERLP